MSEWEQREDGKRQAEVRAARAASIRVLRPLDERTEGGTARGRSCHSYDYRRRSVGREEAPSFLVQNTAAVEWPAEMAANRREEEKEGGREGGKTGVSQRIMNIRIPCPPSLARSDIAERELGHPLSHPARSTPAQPHLTT